MRFSPSFISAAPLTHTWSYKDSDTAVGKAKAAGSIQGELRCTVSATPLTRSSYHADRDFAALREARNARLAGRALAGAAA